jgi:hypothetical protein
MEKSDIEVVDRRVAPDTKIRAANVASRETPWAKWQKTCSNFKSNLSNKNRLGRENYCVIIGRGEPRKARRKKLKRMLLLWLVLHLHQRERGESEGGKEIWTDSWRFIVLGPRVVGESHLLLLLRVPPPPPLLPQVKVGRRM